MSTIQDQKFHFIYQGLEYDASSYAKSHPGGLTIIKDMKNVTKDFTQYFRALHSDQAQKILKSFPIISIKESPSKSSKEYMQIYKKVEKYFEPLWYIELLLFVFISSCWTLGCLSNSSIVSILCFTISQILIGWVGHSCDHNRNESLRLIGRFESALLGGFSTSWWGSKHNVHHMFTNIKKYDQDIQHEYKVYLFEFLFLKWRFDSFISAITKRNPVQLVGILINYVCLALCYENILNWLVGQLIAGFVIAFVLVGNHEKEIRYEEKPNVPFIDHQVTTSRNYRQQNIFWLLFMGGMQYQTEHHLFPQIPFYRLPQAKSTIRLQCSKLGKSFIYGPVI